MFSKEELAELKLVRAERVAVTRGVCMTPCLLYSASIASDGVGAADGQLWNGHGLGDELLYDLYCDDEMMFIFTPICPIYFSRGLYVVVGTNCTAITVQYKPL